MAVYSLVSLVKSTHSVECFYGLNFIDNQYDPREDEKPLREHVWILVHLKFMTAWCSDDAVLYSYKTSDMHLVSLAVA